MKKPHYRSVILSDIHLGTKDSKADEAVKFLKSLRCEKLILNGDIVDGWALKNGGRWKNSHTKFVRTVLKKMEKEGTQIIYLRGNHDDILERFLPVGFGKLVIEYEYTLETPRGDYLVVHGDGFDSLTTNHKSIAVLGSLGYELLLRINRFYNRWRAWRGKEYFSLSKEIKARVKSAVSFVGRYEQQLQELARVRGCRGIICGHIHTVADKMLDDVHYLNSGDWVESLTAIVEKDPGEFEIVHFDEFMQKRRDAMVAEGLEEEDEDEEIPAVNRIRENAALVAAVN